MKYYNGHLLPDFPEGIVEEYPYVFIRLTENISTYHLIFSKQRMYYSSEVIYGVESQYYDATYYSCTKSDKSEWKFVQTLNTHFGMEIASYRRLIWTNTDIPKGSATAIELYMKGSEPSDKKYNSVEDVLSYMSEDAVATRLYSKNDDGTDTINGVDWFTYNGNVCKNIYVSGNSWIGLGANAEHLKVNRQDAACWYVYREEGIVGSTKFLRIRWSGHSRYNYTSNSYKLTYDVILWDTCDISLRLIDVPTSNYAGMFFLGNLAYTKPTADSRDVTFLFQTDGSYLASYSMIEIASAYISQGYVEFIANDFISEGIVIDSNISWEEEKPDNTNIKVCVKLNQQDEYVECVNGDELPILKVGSELSSHNLYVKAELSTEDENVSPSLSELKIRMSTDADESIIVLNLDAGNKNSIQNAIGDVKVKYLGGGSLAGLGGPVDAFEQVFLPTDLTWKGHQNHTEHIEVSLSAAGMLKEVQYSSYKFDEHIEVALSAIGELKHVDDI